MELENMKELWQQYDKNLQASNILNERIVKNMLAEKSHSKINSFTAMEYLSLVVTGIVLMLFISMGYKVGSELQVVVPYVIDIVLLIVIIMWNIYKLRLLGNIDSYNDSIMNTRERAERLKLVIAREKIWVLVLMPVLVCTMVPVLHHWIHGSYFLDQIKAYIPRIIAGSVLGIVLTYWLYNTFYSKNIKIILGNLKEIEALKKE